MKIFLNILLIVTFTLNVFGSTHSDDKIAQTFKYIDQKNWLAAEELANKLNNNTLKKIVLSQSFLDDRNLNNNFEKTINFLRANPKWPQNALIEAKAEKHLNLSTSKKIILDWFNKKPPLTGKGYKYYGLAAGTLIKDQKILLPIIRKVWIYGDFNETEEREYYNKWKKYLSQDDDVKRIDEHLWKNDIKSAKQSLKYVNSGYQNSFKAQIDIINKLPNFEEIFKNVPEKYYTEGLLYRYLDAKKKQMPRAEDIALFKKIKSHHKHSKEWCRLQSYYAREFIDYKDFKNSYNLSAISFAITHDTIREQEWLAGWLALSFLNKPNEALMHFNKFIKVVETSMSLSRGYYWLARSYEAKGDLKLANEFYEKAAKYTYTFYGQAANIELKKDKLIFPSRPLVKLEDRKALEKNDIVKAAKLLFKYGKLQLAVIYSKAAMKYASNSAEILLMLDIIKASNNTHLTVSTAKIASQYNAFILDDVFPTPYKINQDVVEPHFIYSIIKQESVFDHSAVSSAKAMGLMQLIKDTACETTKSLNIKCDVKRLITDPYYNIKVGTHHLQKLLNDHNGSYILAIASYNAGKHNVVKWVDRFGDPRNIKDMRKIIDWLELIPYAETRNYVQRVLENMQVYRAVINKDSSLQLGKDLYGCKLRD